MYVLRIGKETKGEIADLAIPVIRSRCVYKATTGLEQ